MKNISNEYPCDCCGVVFKAERCKIEEVTNGKRENIFCSRKCFNDYKKPKIDNIRKEFANRNYTLVSGVYINNRKKLEYLCNVHKEKGPQFISYTSFTRGRGCRYCGREKTETAKRLDFSFIRSKFKEWNLELISDEYINNSTKLQFICNEHKAVGVQEACFNKLDRAKGKCKYCSYANRKRKYSLIYAQELFEKNGLQLVEEIYKSVAAPMAYICKRHPEEGVQYKKLDSLHLGKNGCRMCTREKIADAQRMSEEEFRQRVFDVHGRILENIEKYINANTKIKFHCHVCKHEWLAWPNNIIYAGQGCPVCNKSRGEKSITKFLEDRYISFTTQKKFEGLVGVGGGELSYDFHIPIYNILIEYQGEYHDNTATNQSDEDFRKQQEHDKRKRKYAKKNGIRLIEIWYWDYKNISKILENTFSNAA